MQKKYVDQHRIYRSFDVGMKVFLRVIPHKIPIRYGKGSKLTPRFFGPFEILEYINPLAYRLAFPPSFLAYMMCFMFMSLGGTLHILLMCWTRNHYKCRIRGR